MRGPGGFAARKAESATAEDPVPPHLKEAHRRYFGDVKKQIDRKTGGAPQGAGTASSPSTGQGGTK